MDSNNFAKTTRSIVSVKDWERLTCTKDVHCPVCIQVLQNGDGLSLNDKVELMGVVGMLKNPAEAVEGWRLKRVEYRAEAKEASTHLLHHHSHTIEMILLRK